MDEADEILILTETKGLRQVRHLGLAIFLSLSLVIFAASLVAALTRG